MAIIYSYPEKTSTTGTDQVLISDSQDDKKTKYVTMQTIADYIDGEVTLQEVLQTGSSATGNTGNNWAGNMSLTQGGNIVAPQIARRFIVDVNGLTGGGSNKTAYLVGDLEIAGNGASDAGDLNMSGSFEVVGNGTIAGNLNMSEATSNIIFSGGVITSTALWGVGIRPSAGQNIELDTGAGGNITLTGSGTADLIANMGGIIDITSTGNATFSTGTKDYLIADAASGSTTLEGKSTFIYTRGATGSVISIGGTTANTRPDSIMSQAENIFQVKTTTGTSRFYMHGGSSVNTPGINSVSPHSFYDEIRLGGTAATFNDTDGSVLTAGTAGSAGTAGDLLSSQGSGSAPQWVSASSLSVAQVIEDVQFASAVIKGTAVYISGPAHGSGRPTVDIADAFLAAPKMPAIGLALEDYAAGQGKVIITGVLDIDLTTHGTFGVGNVLYIKDQGGAALNTNLQNTKPTGNAKIQNVGIVAKAGANGAVQVSCIGRINDLPQFDAPNSFWVGSSNNTPVGTTANVEYNAAQQTFSLLSFYKIDASSPVGTANTFIGSNAAQSAYDTGGAPTNSVYIGDRAGQGVVGSNNDSNFNIAIGSQTLAGNNNAVVTDPLRTTTVNNIAIGHQALSQPGGGAPTAPVGAHVRSGNIAIGYQNMPSLYGLAGTEGTNNTSIGNSAGFNMETGLENTFVGANSGNNVTTGTGNTLVGYGARTRNAADEYSVALGHDAEANSLGIALGTMSRAGAGEFNINVSGSLATPRGGLLSVSAAAGPFPPAGVSPGDVYVIQDVDMANLGGPAGQLVNIMAIA